MATEAPSHSSFHSQRRRAARSLTVGAAASPNLTDKYVTEKIQLVVAFTVVRINILLVRSSSTRSQLFLNVAKLCCLPTATLFVV